MILPRCKEETIYERLSTSSYPSSVAKTFTSSPTVLLLASTNQELDLVIVAV
jgi:hypothetical protein